MLSIIALLCVNTYNTNNRLFKDTQLQKLVKNKYEFQFMTKEELKQDDPRLERIMDFSRFPNLKTIKLLGLRSQEPIIIDIRNVQNIESIEIGLGVKKIIGLEEAVNLKNIDLYHESNDYKDEIKKLRPDIELP